MDNLPLRLRIIIFPTWVTELGQQPAPAQVALGVLELFLRRLDVLDVQLQSSVARSPEKPEPLVAEKRRKGTGR